MNISAITNNEKIVSLCSSVNLSEFFDFLNSGGKIPKEVLQNGDTLLHTVLRNWPSCFHDRKEMLAKLLENGLSPLTHNNKSVTPLKLAKALLVITQNNFGTRSAEHLYLRIIIKLFKEAAKKQKNNKNNLKCPPQPAGIFLKTSS
jgi:hypothetical protein